MTDIVLATINARWAHASFGLRCLQANLGALAARSVIVERTLEHRAVDIVEELLAHAPRVVGLGVYIWNAQPLLEVVRALKQLRPEIVVVLGGPEVSHEVDAQEIVRLADYTVTGEGEDAFRALCERVLGAGRGLPVVGDKIIAGGRPDLVSLRMPYALYSDADLKDRVIYVEASRGCPFTCSFCLSALDDGVRTFPIDAFLGEMQRLLDRGLLHFKFVDRTFNLKIDDATRILDFFLERMRPGLFVHFEMIPDRLPEPLRERLARFPPGSVQLEVGIQTLDEETAHRIRRRQDVGRLEENLRFLRDTGVHVHADLIAGLPGEDLASFGRSFDRLYALAPTEIQVGLLKRLRGAPLAADARAHPEWGMVFDESPPYALLQNAALSFSDVQRIGRFARAMDLVANSGRFRATTVLLFADAPFAGFLAFADWLFAEAGARHGIALARLVDLITRYLVDVRGLPRADVDVALEHDVGRDRLPATALPPRQARSARP